MPVEDAVLPAAVHLTGADADLVLRAALDPAGGSLIRARPSHLNYRPGHDVVVRFDGRVRWTNGTATDETLVAATTINGPPPGTLPVEAVTDEGTHLAVGVWRWPFDPVLAGLTDAVTRSHAAAWLDGLVSPPLTLDVVAYRPTQRAVVHAIDGAGDELYLKAVPPRDVPALVERHQRLLAAGVPVPEVLRHDAEQGLIAMTALTGPTVRDRVKKGQRWLPGAEQYEDLYARLATVELPSARPVLSRARGSLYHAAMLARVLPGERRRLDRLVEILTPAAERADARSGQTIHGDLYEAQLVTGVGRGRSRTITGVLDLDDAGPGDPLDDRATVIAHLVERLVESPAGARARAVIDYAAMLRDAFAQRVDPVELDLVIASALVGLATGPFRLQRTRWRQAIGRRLTVATRFALRPGEGTVRSKLR